jgi:hypothetical protein
MLRRALSCSILGCTLVLAACSSSDSGGSPQGVIPQAFASYCSGTLKTDQKLMTPMSGGGWMGNGSLHAAAGTPFLVSTEGGQWAGYVVQADGSVDKIDADFTKGLVRDTDFTSDCATDTALHDFASDKNVVLAKSTIYATKDLTGTACTLDAGTTMTNFNYASGGFGGSSSGPSTVGSDEIKAKCGFASGYTNDLEFASLIPKP